GGCAVRLDVGGAVHSGLRVPQRGRELIPAEVRHARRLSPEAAGDPETVELALEVVGPAALDRAVTSAGGQKDAQAGSRDRLRLPAHEQRRVVRRECRSRRVLERPVEEWLEVALPRLRRAEQTEMTQRDVDGAERSGRYARDRPRTRGAD